MFVRRFTTNRKTISYYLLLFYCTIPIYPTVGEQNSTDFNIL